MNLKPVTKALLPAALLIMAGECSAQSAATNAIGVGGGVHPEGSVGPIVEYEHLLNNDSFSLGVRYLKYDYTYDDDDYHEKGSGGGGEIFGQYYFCREGFKGPYVGAGIGRYSVDWDWHKPWSSYATYGSGTTKGTEASARFGWKFPFGNRFYVDPAVQIGNFFGSSKDDTGEEEDNLGAYAALVVTLGFKF